MSALCLIANIRNFDTFAHSCAAYLLIHLRFTPTLFNVKTRLVKARYTGCTNKKQKRHLHTVHVGVVEARAVRDKLLAIWSVSEIENVRELICFGIFCFNVLRK